MVEKMIKQTYIEIIIIIIFVFLSIPLWYYVSTKWQFSLAEIINNNEKLELIRNNIGGYDNIIVNNGYENSKKYRILLITDFNCREDYIKINDAIYQLKDIEDKSNNKKYTYVIGKGTLKQSRTGYKILTNLKNKNINYYYILEDITNV